MNIISYHCYIILVLFLPQIGMIFECMGMPRFRLEPHYQDQSFHFPTNILRTTAATVKASTARPNKRSDCLGALVSKKLKLALCCRMELQPKNSHQMNRHVYTAYTQLSPFEDTLRLPHPLALDRRSSCNFRTVPTSLKFTSS